MENNSEVVYLYLDDIIPNRFQPREVFDDQALKELAVSIKEHGVIQPIIVRQVENKYEIIAGERRYKASTMAGLTKIPAIVKNLDDKESSKVALIENLQRKDLTPIEEARTYQKILELEGAMTQEELAATMGKTQSSVSNKLRLLALPEEIQDALLKERISERHARSLLNIADKNEQIKMMERVVAEKMTVRELDKVIKEMNGEPAGDATGAAPAQIIQTPNTNVTIENNSLSASDLVNETPEKPKASAFDAFREIKSELNPTTVDVEQIRVNAVDINQANKEPEPANNGSSEGFKFVPTFGINYMNNMNNNTEGNNVENKEEENKFSQTTPSVTTENNNFLSSVDQPGLVISGEPKNVQTAIDNIKGTNNNLKDEGYIIVFNEADEAGDYKITISIKKDA